MNVICPACSTRYTVPDDKVAGKRARMQCKKCGGGIAIDGTALGASAAASVRPPPVGAPAIVWNIAQPSGRRDILSTADLLDRYQRDEVEPGSLVWRDGMENWLPPYDVKELAEAFAERGIRLPGLASHGPPSDDEDEATRVGALPLDPRALDSAALHAESRLVSGWREPGRDKQLTFSDETQSLGVAEAALLKRKAMRTMEDFEGFGEKSDELFDEVTRAIDSLPRVIPPTPRPAPRPPTPPSSSPPDEATRVYDTTAHAHGAQAHAALADETDEATRVYDTSQAADAGEDEATRMFTGKVGQQAHAHAPLPPRAPGPAPAPVPGARAPLPPAAPVPHAPAPRPPLPAPAPPVAASAPHAAAAPHAPAAPLAPSAPQPNPFLAGAPPVAPPGAPLPSPRPFLSQEHDEHELPGVGEATRLSQRPAQTERRAAYTPPAKSRALWLFLLVVLAVGTAVYVLKPEWITLAKESLGFAATAPSSEVEAEGPPFDANAAGLALAEAATTASRCKVPDGPTGPGRVHVKYLPTGRVATASVSDPYSGTDVGECLVNVFENTKVPPFGGKPVIVGKNFVIE